MSHWVRFNFAPVDGKYLCYCNDIVSSWQEVLTMWNGVWYDLSGKQYDPIVSHWMRLPSNPED